MAKSVRDRWRVKANGVKFGRESKWEMGSSSRNGAQEGGKTSLEERLGRREATRALYMSEYEPRQAR